MHDFQTRRRGFLVLAASLALGASGAVRASAPAWTLLRLSTETLDIAYHAAGPEDGRPVVLLHDQDGGVELYADVAAVLAAKGVRVLMPCLRGYRMTRLGNEQPGTIAKDMIGFLDALHTPEAVFAGIGLGARVANAFVAVKPTRCVGLLATDKAPDSSHAFANAIHALVLSAKWRT